MEAPTDKLSSESSESTESDSSSSSSSSYSSNEQDNVRESFQIKYGRHLVKLCVGDGRVLGARSARESWIFSPLRFAFFVHSVILFDISYVK